MFFFCTKCVNCDYEDGTAVAATGHSYAGGICSARGEKEPVPDLAIGDANGDGKINSIDINTMKRYLSGSVDPTPAQKAASDVNGDGLLNSVDANILSRYVSGSISSIG